MPVQLEFDFGGTQSADALASAVAARLHALQLDQIATIITNRRAPVWLVSRLIASGIAGVVRNMQQMPGRRVPPFNNQIKAFRALQRSLIESDSGAETFDMDGPKFRFVFARIVDLFQAAVNESGAGGELTKRVMARVGELLTEKQESLRRLVEFVDLGPARKLKNGAAPHPMQGEASQDALVAMV